MADDNNTRRFSLPPTPGQVVQPSQAPDAGKPAVTRDALNTPPTAETAEEARRRERDQRERAKPPSERGVFGADAPDVRADLERIGAALHRLSAARARFAVLYALAIAPAKAVLPIVGPVGSSSIPEFAESFDEEIRQLTALATLFEAAVVFEVRHSGHPEVRYAPFGMGLPSPLLSFGAAKLRARVPAELVLTRQQLEAW